MQSHPLSSLYARASLLGLLLSGSSCAPVPPQPPMVVTVRNVQTNAPIENATVAVLTSGGQTVQLNPSRIAGDDAETIVRYFGGVRGDVTLAVSAPSFAPTSRMVTVPSGAGGSNLSFQLTVTLAPN